MAIGYSRAALARTAAVTAVVTATIAAGANFYVNKKTPTGASATANIQCWGTTSGGQVMCLRENGTLALSGSVIANGVTLSAGGAPSVNSGGVLQLGDARYVNTSGDTMTGALKVRASLSGTSLTIDSSATISGTLLVKNSIKSKSTISGSTLYGKRCPAEYAIQYAASGTTLAVNSGTTLSIPIGHTLSGFTLTSVSAKLSSAGTTGLTRFGLRNISKGKRQLFSTLPSINSAATTIASYTINSSNALVSGGDELSFDILQIQTGTAPKGLKLWLTFSCP